jgi:hypothetical protein
MASATMPPPKHPKMDSETFNEDWDMFLEEFDDFATLTGLYKKDEKHKLLNLDQSLDQT